MKNVFVGMIIQSSLITNCVCIWSSVYHDSRMPLQCNYKKKISGQCFVAPTNLNFLAKHIPSLTLNTADIHHSLFTTNGTEHFASLSPCENALCLI